MSGHVNRSSLQFLLRFQISVTHPVIRTFRMSDGYRLHYRHWVPAGRPLARIVALHGIQSHSGWYEYSTRKLCEAGYEVYFLDRRGSGMNEVARGDTPHHERWINDVVQFLGEVRATTTRDLPGCPVVLQAVSWGGKPAVVAAARRPELLDALALLYPGLCPRIGPWPHQRLQLRLAEGLGIRKKLVPVPLRDPALFVGDPKWQEHIRHDPLALHEVTVRFLLANRELDRLVRQSPERLSRPTLLMLSGKDRIIDNRATRRYFARCGASHLTQIEYADAQHTLEFEPDRDRFIGHLLQWLKLMVEGV